MRPGRGHSAQFLLIPVLLLLFQCSRHTLQDQPEPALLQFPNGDINHWLGDTTIWYVNDSILVGSTMKQQIPGAIWLVSNDHYDDFELSLWVKLTGDENKNSGVYYRGQWDDDVVVGYEFDIGGWGTDGGESEEENWWGELHDPYRRDDLWIGPGRTVIDSTSREGEWNHVRIRAEGDHIQHWLNGRQMVDWYETDPAIQTSGFIGFQLHDESNCMVQIRDIELIPLGDK